MDRWQEYERSTAPVRKARAEAAIKRVYKIIDRPNPLVVWCGSPLAISLVLNVLKGRRTTFHVSNRLHGVRQVRAPWMIEEPISPSVSEGVWEAVKAVHRGQKAGCGPSIYGAVDSAMWRARRGGVGYREAQPAHSFPIIRLQVEAVVGGSLAWGTVWANYWRYMPQLETAEGTRAFAVAARSVGWMAPCRNVCFVCPRPRVLSFDATHRLHSTTGPALAYRDGWEVYAWQGNRVPKDWVVNPDKADPIAILTERNAERRRAGIELVGWSRLLKKLNAHLIDRDRDPQVGTLLAVDLPPMRGVRGAPRMAQFLRVQCGTGREFAVGVPHHLATALDAQAWLRNIPREEFRIPRVRT